MTLGEKLRQARVERGLSQSQVAGEHMTRNMLSQLEHDQASPSVKTLLYLAETLCVSAGWLLDDKTSVDFSAVTVRARETYRRGAFVECFQTLGEIGEPLDDEQSLLLFRSAAACAEQALKAGKLEEADRLLQAAEQCRSLYLEKADRLPVLKLRLQCALAQGKPNDALLQAVLEAWHTEEAEELTARHDLLKGRLAVEENRMEDALPHLHRAESTGSLRGRELHSLYRLLELCYKAREDYKLAYHYATLRTERKMIP